VRDRWRDPVAMSGIAHISLHLPSVTPTIHLKVASKPASARMSRLRTDTECQNGSPDWLSRILKSSAKVGYP
jgi:hypothetical protein